MLCVCTEGPFHYAFGNMETRLEAPSGPRERWGAGRGREDGSDPEGRDLGRLTCQGDGGGRDTTTNEHTPQGHSRVTVF